MNGLGLNVTGFSYHGTLWVCAVACREMMPDPAFFAACLREAFGDLSGAARAQAQPEHTVSAATQQKVRPSSGRNRRDADTSGARKSQQRTKRRGARRASTG